MKSIKEIGKKLFSVVKKVGIVISTVVNFVLLSIVYIAGVGLTSIIAKLFGKQFLLLKRPKKDSYWIDHKIGKKKLTDYYWSF